MPVRKGRGNSENAQGPTLGADPFKTQESILFSPRLTQRQRVMITQIRYRKQAKPRKTEKLAVTTSSSLALHESPVRRVKRKEERDESERKRARFRTHWNKSGEACLRRSALEFRARRKGKDSGEPKTAENTRPQHQENGPQQVRYEGTKIAGFFKARNQGTPLTV